MTKEPGMWQRRTSLRVLFALAFLSGPISIQEAAASGACCSLVLTPGQSAKQVSAAAYWTLAQSDEHLHEIGPARFDQSAASLKVNFPIYRRLGGGVLLGKILRSSLRDETQERKGYSGFMYGFQLGLPIWIDRQREFDVSWGGSWSYSRASLDSMNDAGIARTIDQKFVIEEWQTNLMGSKCFGPVDLTSGVRWFSGKNELKGSGAMESDGEREGHWGGTIGSRVHLGSEERSLVLEYGFGALTTYSAGLAVTF